MIFKRKNISHHQTLFLLCLLNFILKIFLWKFSNYAVHQDSVGWLASAQSVKEFDFLSYQIDRPGFVYSLLIALVSMIINDLEVCGILISVLTSTLLVVPIFYISLNIFNRNIALLASLLVIVYPALNLYSIAILSESTFITVVMMGMLVGYYAWRSQNSWLYFISGFFMGLVYLTRAEGIGFGLALFLWFLAAIFDKAEVAYKKWHNLILYIIPFSSLVFLGVLFLYWRTGVWALTSQVGNIAFGLEEGENLGRIRNDLGNVYTYFLAHYKSFALKYLFNLRDIFSHSHGLPAIFFSPLLLLVGIGLGSQNIWEKENKKSLIFLLLFLMPPILVIPISHVVSRYFIVLIPLLIILVAAGIEELDIKAEKNRIFLLKKKNVMVLLMIPLLILSLSPTFRSYLNLLPIYAIEYKETGLWIKQHIPKTAVLFSQVTIFNYHAQREAVIIRKPYGRTIYETQTLDEILSLASNKKIDYYLIVQERWRSTTLHNLLSDHFHHDRLKRIYVNNKYPKAKVVIYKIVPV